MHLMLCNESVLLCIHCKVLKFWLHAPVMRPLMATVYIGNCKSLQPSSQRSVLIVTPDKCSYVTSSRCGRTPWGHLVLCTIHHSVKYKRNRTSRGGEQNKEERGLNKNSFLFSQKGRERLEWGNRDCLVFNGRVTA